MRRSPLSVCQSVESNAEAFRRIIHIACSLPGTRSRAEKQDDLHYRILVTYNEEDETEMLIRLLSFGPVVKVRSPEDFVMKIRDRLIKQKRFQSSMGSSA